MSAPPAPALIQVRDLEHWFEAASDGRRVLQGIELTLHRGEILILTGPSGSGKTTLLTLLGGLRAPRSGSLQVLGEELSQAGPSQLSCLRRRIGYIFQAHNLMPYLNAVENVRLGLEVQSHWLHQGRAAMDACAAACLVELGLEQRLQALPEQLSGGQKQRVAIARAVAARPPLLLADEPTAALDREASRDVVQLFRRLADVDGCGIVMVTHDNRILDIADRIVHLEGGRLLPAPTPPADAG
ncbi:MAG: ATP-binding cassette domain-containing protein [Cyanobacteriota bacterium]|nr:ATP-binding cassette domain-containing protein [Cyanobacteriota bacterium]